MSEPIRVQKNHEREFCVYNDHISKRSFQPQEYVLNQHNQPYVPPLGLERLQNEAACLKYIRENTNIPVPDVLEAYEENGSFILVTKLLPGVQMNELSPEDQKIVMQEVDEHIRTLQTLRIDRTGGPSGIVCPPRRVTEYFPKGHSWPSLQSSEANFVFCHCDLSQSNIIVNSETLKIGGIVDWEHEGFWPPFFESSFFRDPRPSGAQFTDPSENSKFVRLFGDNEAF